MRGDVGRPADRIFMPGDKDPVARRDEVGLDEVGPAVDRQRIAFERMFGTQARRAAVADDDWRDVARSAPGLAPR